MSTIETEQLRLRRLEPRDMESYFTGIYADAEVMRTLGAGRPLAREEFTTRIPAFAHGHWERHGFGPWIVADRASDEVIGHAGLKFWPDSTEVEVFYALARSHWGRGLATEAASACLWFGFERVALDHIVGAAFLENVASRRVLAKIGLRYFEERTFVGRTVAWHELHRRDYQPAAGPGRLIEP